MRTPTVSLLALLLLLSFAGCQPAKPTAGPDVERMKAAMEAVRPLHQPKSKIVFAGDWLYSHPEPGQTFQEYLTSRPTLPRGVRRVISVRPMGELTPAQLRIVEITADYLGRFFGLPARMEPPVPLTWVPARARRHQPAWDTEQIRTGYLLGKVLKPLLPLDAVAHIGLTSSDLYPNEKFNFVFGQADLRSRVGVWSLFHLGEPDKNDQELRVALVRALKIASHETGHMFSLHHCTKYECVLNGANSLYEVDGHPIDVCPECMAKICWATGCDPRKRYEALAAFSLRHGLRPEQLFFERSQQALTKASL